LFWKAILHNVEPELLGKVVIEIIVVPIILPLLLSLLFLCLIPFYIEIRLLFCILVPHIDPMGPERSSTEVVQYNK
jgi:hypothetical protein